MKKTEAYQNKVKIIGEVSSDLIFAHETKSATMYTFMVKIPRLSGAIDEIPVIISDIVLDNIGISIEKGAKYEIVGEYRSYNEWPSGNDVNKKMKVKLYVFVKDMYLSDSEDINNKIELEGYVAKVKPVRETPFGRKIIDLIVAVNRPANKSSYIPCIIWNPTKHREESLEVGKRISLYGRIQSREYEKKYDDETSEIKTTYEVSVQKFSVEEE